MGSPSISLLSGMLVIAGHFRVRPPTVLVATPSALNMRLHAKQVAFTPLDIMRCGTSQPPCCHGVTIEQHFQPLTGENMSHNTAITDDGARLDISMYGFWGGCFEKAFVDVTVFNPCVHGVTDADSVEFISIKQ